ncbi:MAG: Arf-GAP with coiled-coil, ANK repeat and PH domain-containing protein 1 [Paramarteilia canceri]
MGKGKKNNKSLASLSSLKSIKDDLKNIDFTICTQLEALKMIDENEYEDKDPIEIKENILIVQKLVKKLELIDFGNCLKDSIETKSRIKMMIGNIPEYENFTNHVILNYSVISSFKLINQIKTILKAQKMLRAFESDLTDKTLFGLYSELNDDLVGKKKNNLQQKCFSYLKNSLNDKDEKYESFYNTSLIQLVYHRNYNIKKFKSLSSKYDKHLVEYESILARKSSNAPRMSILMTKDDQSTQNNIKNFYLAQLDLVHYINRVYIEQLIIPFLISSDISQCLNLYKLDREKISFFDLKISLKENLDNEHILFRKIYSNSKKAIQIINRLDRCYHSYKKSLETGNFKNYMLGPVGGYISRKIVDSKKDYTVRCWHTIENYKLIEISKKSQKSTIIEDVTKYSPKLVSKNANSLNCFDLISPIHGTLRCKCDSLNEAKHWINKINDTIIASQSSSNSCKDNEISDDIFIISISERIESSKPQMKSSFDQHNTKAEMMSSIIGNDNCADCESLEIPEWVSVNQGVAICIACSGKHRALGAKYSKIKSIQLDSLNEIVIKVCCKLGNKLCNCINEWSLRDIPEQARREIRM